jgi:hypothetical protein
MPFDHFLLHQARKLTTGANVHLVKTWIFCYENSLPGSAAQAHYEELIRGFVRSRHRNGVVREQAEALPEHSARTSAKQSTR